MREVKPEDTNRAEAFTLWMKAPMPMLSFSKRMDVTRLAWVAAKRKLKFNMLMCWAIGKAASGIDEFFLLPVGNKLIKYDKLAICVIIANSKGTLSSCDVPFSQDLSCFADDYLCLTDAVRKNCENHDLCDHMVIGTSAMIQTELDSISGMHSGIYNNPFLFWGRYARHWFRFYLTISFQFHHVQMDGANAANFLESLQKEFRKID